MPQSGLGWRAMPPFRNPEQRNRHASCAETFSNHLLSAKSDSVMAKCYAISDQARGVISDLIIETQG